MDPELKAFLEGFLTVFLIIVGSVVLLTCLFYCFGAS